MNKGLTGSAVADLLGDAGEVAHPLATIEGCKERATALYFEITRHHGLAAANRIFDRLGTPPNAKKFKENQLRTWFEIGRAQGWTDVKTASKLLSWNKKTPKEYRIPYAQSETSILKKINRLGMARATPGRPRNPRRKPTK